MSATVNMKFDMTVFMKVCHSLFQFLMICFKVFCQTLGIEFGDIMFIIIPCQMPENSIGQFCDAHNGLLEGLPEISE